MLGVQPQTIKADPVLFFLSCQIHPQIGINALNVVLYESRF